MIVTFQEYAYQPRLLFCGHFETGNGVLYGVVVSNVWVEKGEGTAKYRVRILVPWGTKMVDFVKQFCYVVYEVYFL